MFHVLVKLFSFFFEGLVKLDSRQLYISFLDIMATFSFQTYYYPYIITWIIRYTSSFNFILFSLLLYHFAIWKDKHVIQDTRNTSFMGVWMEFIKILDKLVFRKFRFRCFNWISFHFFKFWNKVIRFYILEFVGLLLLCPKILG